MDTQTKDMTQPGGNVEAPINLMYSFIPDGKGKGDWHYDYLEPKSPVQVAEETVGFPTGPERQNFIYALWNSIKSEWPTMTPQEQLVLVTANGFESIRVFLDEKNIVEIMKEGDDEGRSHKKQRAATS